MVYCTEKNIFLKSGYGKDYVRLAERIEKDSICELFGDKLPGVPALNS